MPLPPDTPPPPLPPPLPTPLQLPGLTLSGELPPPVVSALQALTAERVYLETSYLDADLRIARGPNRELYVLSK